MVVVLRDWEVGRASSYIAEFLNGYRGFVDHQPSFSLQCIAMEAFNHGAWWGARSVSIQGRVIVDFDNQNLCSQEMPLDKLRWRSRKATPSDCGYLKPGLEVAVLSSSPSAISKGGHNLGGEDSDSCFGDNKVSGKFKSASLSGQVITQGSSVYFIMVN